MDPVEFSAWLALQIRQLRNSKPESWESPEFVRGMLAGLEAALKKLTEG